MLLANFFTQFSTVKFSWDSYPVTSYHIPLPFTFSGFSVSIIHSLWNNGTSDELKLYSFVTKLLTPH